ncbi:MAG: PaaI family thioesterase [Acidobacteriota bacterium]|nr:PaaI family thioesterase [Acidobacteriota bacterium]
MSPPPANPETGWTPVQPFPSLDSHSFLVANPSGESVRIAYFRGPGPGVLYAKAWFGRETQGPPGHVHGGAMAAVLDETMGGACWMNGHRTVAAKISVSFLEMLKLETETTVEARIERVDGRKVYVRAVLLDGARRVAEADGLFIVLCEEALNKT